MYDMPLIGQAPDYADAERWLALPDNPHLPVDLVYLYPSACEDPGAPLICAIDEPTMMAQAKNYFAQQCQAFEQSCNIFAPWYRQVSSTSVMTLPFEETDAAQWAEPRTDVYAALDYYFEHLNDGRPWMIAGCSQGSRMLGIALGEYMREHPAYYARMIAAYRIGDGLTRSYLAKYPHVKPAQSADDLGVCISYNTEGPANAGHSSLVVPPECVAINPLNWKTDDTPASADLCLGCYFPVYGTSELIPLEEKISTVLDLDRSTVIVTSPDMTKYSIAASGEPEFRPFSEALFGPKSYHNCDYGFFLNNLRENVRLRIQKWFEKHPRG